MQILLNLLLEGLSRELNLLPYLVLELLQILHVDMMKICFLLLNLIFPALLEFLLEFESLFQILNDQFLRIHPYLKLFQCLRAYNLITLNLDLIRDWLRCSTPRNIRILGLDQPLTTLISLDQVDRILNHPLLLVNRDILFLLSYLLGLSHNLAIDPHT